MCGATRGRVPINTGQTVPSRRDRRVNLPWQLACAPVQFSIQMYCSLSHICRRRQTGNADKHTKLCLGMCRKVPLLSTMLTNVNRDLHRWTGASKAEYN